MLEHNRKHRVPSGVKAPEQSKQGVGVHTEGILDGLQKVGALTALVESTLIWRAAHVAWNTDLYKAEQILVRMIFKEGCENPQAMDLLARIYCQQQRYEKAKDLWERAVALQPGSPILRRSLAKCIAVAKSPTKEISAYRMKLAFRAFACAVVILFVSWGGVLGFNGFQRWMEGPQTAERLAGRFHYDYESQVGNFRELYGDEDLRNDQGNGEIARPMGFTRRQIVNGTNLGRIEVFVERKGNSVKVTGKVPSLHLRYLVEHALAELPGVQNVDLRSLEIDRTYRVRPGDSLWIISRRMFGSGAGWTTLARYNNLDNPSALKIGQELSLPLGNEYLVPER